MKKLVLSLILGIMIFPASAQREHYHFLIGTYTDGTSSEGIYAYEVDMDKDFIREMSVAKNVINPSYLALSEDEAFLYSVNENGNNSTVGAFRFYKETGEIIPLNEVTNYGADPCYLSVTDKHVITADYSSGTISVYGRNPDGSLTDTLQFIRHIGKSTNPERQEGAHVHQTVLLKNNRYLLATDLGTDNIQLYKYKENESHHILVAKDSIKMKKGSGPRHLVLNNAEDKAYVLHELDGTVTVLSLDEKGKMKIIQETSVVTQDDVKSGAAEIYLSPDEKFLYATNRGTANDITCFSVGQDDKLTFVQQIPTGGEGPCHFNITPDGKYIFIGNQQSHIITIFERNEETGMLTDTGKTIEIGAPVCLIFF
ncbi:MAG: lactonase family protein [Candidatus Azobacteroides sp.]|nr:lactonase family protein [Candidatus Azobacteroides sp.]